MVISSVLVLLLVACSGNNNENGNGNGGDTVYENGNGNEDQNGNENVNGNEGNPVGLAESGRSFGTLTSNQVEPDEWLLSELANFTIAGIEVSFDDDYGVVLLMPVNINQEPWITILSELEDGELTEWGEFIADVLIHFASPMFSNYVVVMVNPLNDDLFWLKLENGVDIVYSAFELVMPNEPGGATTNEPGDASPDGPPSGGPGSVEEEVCFSDWCVNLDSLRELFTGSIVEVEIPISLIIGIEVTSVEELLGLFGPGMVTTNTQGVADFAEFTLTVNFANANDTNIRYATLTLNPITNNSREN